MQSFELLVSLIYHEKQQPGSMLCAQHALNSLLQEHLFTAPDLSDIARNLDNMESHMDDDNPGTSSTNMDDTGFFSVQVLDNALEVWGLKLVRWRAQEMVRYHDHPHTQLAFILNSDQHWYTLRRFGEARPKVDDDPGQGHWFNLNSFRSAPEWVSRTYLGMWLQQAETEGYSVFAVVQINPNGPLALPRTEADAVAATLPDPTPGTLSQSMPSGISSSQAKMDHGIEGFEDEDMELQAALQASLTEGPNPTFAQHRLPLRSTIRPGISNPSSAAASGALTPRDFDLLDDNDEDHTDTPEPTDPVAASMRRNQALLQRMEQEQRMAQREIWQEEDQQLAARRRRQEEEEEEMLRKAIEESEATAREHAIKQTNRPKVPAPVEVTPSVPQGDSMEGISGSGYDYDAELQAALKASLEEPQRLTSASNVKAGNDEETDTDEPMDPSDAANVDMEEMRRRRLAKFGASS